MKPVEELETIKNRTSGKVTTDKMERSPMENETPSKVDESGEGSMRAKGYDDLVITLKMMTAMKNRRTYPGV